MASPSKQIRTYRRTRHGKTPDLDDNFLPTEQPTPLLSAIKDTIYAMSWPVPLLRI